MFFIFVMYKIITLPFISPEVLLPLVDISDFPWPVLFFIDFRKINRADYDRCLSASKFRYTTNLWNWLK